MLTKWLLKNGFGSPGQTAKVYCERYKYYYDSCNGNTQEIMKVLYGERVIVNLCQENSKALFDMFPIEGIIDMVENDFPYFIYIMMFVETSNFRDSVAQQNKLFATAIEVIYDTVKQYCPNTIYGDLGDLVDITNFFTETNYSLVRFK